MRKRTSVVVLTVLAWIAQVSSQTQRTKYERTAVFDSGTDVGRLDCRGVAAPRILLVGDTPNLGFGGRTTPSGEGAHSKGNAWSADGGATFEDYLVSDMQFLPAPIRAPGDSDFVGQHTSVATPDSGVWPRSTDNQTGFHQVYSSPMVLPPRSEKFVEYFPLGIGESWTYVSAFGSTIMLEESVVGAISIHGKTWYQHTGSRFDLVGIGALAIDTIGVDSIGRVWRYEFGQKYMLFDFSIDSGQTYTTETSYPFSNTVRVRKNLTVDVPAGHFEDCIDLYFERSFVDESVGFIFAPYVGIVQWYGPFIGIMKLNNTTISSTRESPVGPPLLFSLGQNYPNPFNPTTTISFTLHSSLITTLTIHNILGQWVAMLVNDKLDPGTHSVTWDATGFPSGVYLYQLSAGGFSLTRKLVLLR